MPPRTKLEVISYATVWDYVAWRRVEIRVEEGRDLRQRMVAAVWDRCQHPIHSVSSEQR